MSLATIEQLRAAIDEAVPRLGGPPKVKGSDLNAVLRLVTDELLRAETPALPSGYEEVIHFPGEPLFHDTVFEPGVLRLVQASAGVARLEVAVGAADFVEVLAAPATTALPGLALPVGPLTYRLTFAPDAGGYAAIKQIIDFQSINVD